MVAVKKKPLSTNCNKHHAFVTGIDRLQYVKACIKDYVNDLKLKSFLTSTKTCKTLKYTLKTTLNKKYFFTFQDRENCSEFFCMMCSEHITTPNWLNNLHFVGTSTPICDHCMSSEIMK